jgi:hypothetical protein
MKDFTDILVDKIISQERGRLDKVMKEVTTNIRRDFAEKMYELLDEYYENYEPIRYVRLYGRKKKLRRGATTMKSKKGGVSLHAAVTRGGIDAPAIGYVGGSYDEGYYFGGISFNSDYFTGEDNNIRHIGKGKNFTEWNIVENFLFAGEGGYGDWRSTPESGWSGQSADTEMQAFMDAYGPTFDKHYKNALKHNK